MIVVIQSFGVFELYVLPFDEGRFVSRQLNFPRSLFFPMRFYFFAYWNIHMHTKHFEFLKWANAFLEKERHTIPK